MRSYKAARRAALKAPVEFDYEYETDDGTAHSEHFVCTGEVSSLMLSEFAYNAEIAVATNEGMALIRKFLTSAFGVQTKKVGDQEVVVEDDAVRQYRRFFQLHTQYGSDELLMEILAGLVEDFVGRPTVQPTSSQSGQSTSGPTSRDDSSPAAIAQRRRFTVLEGLEELEASSA